MGMEISQLKTIIQVAELGSLSKAADRLHIAQPALSRQVRMLEEELGVRLFDRHGRGMVVTEAGKDVLRHAHRVMNELDEIRASVIGADAQMRGHVSIGMPPTVADVLSVSLVSAFQKRHPEATLRIVSAYSGYVLDWLHRGDIDMAILYETRPARSLRSRFLLEEQLHLIGPSGCFGNDGQPHEFGYLTDQRLLLPSAGHGLRRIVDDCASVAKIPLDVRVEADSYSTLKDLVRTGHGLTILPLAPIHQDLASGHLSHSALIDPAPVRRLMMSFPSDRTTSRLTEFAGRVLVDTARDLVESGIWSGRLLTEDGAFV